MTTSPAGAALPRSLTARRLWLHQARLPLSYVAAVAVSLGFVFPFVVMLTTAFKPADEVFTLPPSLLPETWRVENFSDAFASMPFWRYLSNSLIVAGGAVLGTVLASPLVAYSLSKIAWRGRGPLTFLVLATMMLPPQVTMIPIFLIWDRLGLTGTYLPLIVPAFFGTPFFIFLMRQFFLTLPNDLLDAARIDGASEWRIYRSIMLPLAKPAVATIALFQFLWSWTDFLNPLIYLNDQDAYTLSLGLYRFFSDHGVDWGPLMAASALFTAPALVIFLIGQRYFVEGIATQGFK